MKTAVIALGGNALLRAGQKGTIEEVRSNVSSTTKVLAKLVSAGYDLVITHGNGPQVGRLLTLSETMANEFPPFPLDVCNAQSEGEIGYIIANSLDNDFRELGLNKHALSILTRVTVDKNDPAFNNPTKPIGKYYTKEEAEVLQKTKKWIMKEDKARGGWRRVVPSPKPVGIVEINVLKKLIFGGENQEEIIVAAGGGGIPVILEGNHYVGIEAVIDKDLAASRLATAIGEKTFIIVTDIDGVYLNFKKPDEKLISKIGLKGIKAFYEQGIFPEGSMKPKVEAAINFLSNGGEKVIITDITHLESAIEGKAGTTIIKE